MERRLTFYGWRSADPADPFDRLQAAALLARLPDDAHRKVARGAYSADVLLIEAGTDARPTRVIVLRLRDYDSRPYVRRPGDPLAPVSMARDADIIEASHGVIWPDNFAAFVQGGFAPPPSYLSDFLSARTQQYVAFDALFDRTLVQRLQGLEGIRAVEVRIRNSQATQDVQDRQLGPFSGLFRRFQGQSQEVVLSQELRVPGRGKGARRAVLAAVSPGDVIAMAAQADQLYDTFRVTGLDPDGKVQHIDLLNERLHIVRRIPRSRRGGNLTDNAPTFAALLAAREELESDGRLQEAATSQPVTSP